MQIVGIVLVRNEDVFVEQAIRNVAAFCDRIHTVDHVSTDRTWDVLRALGREYEHVDAWRVRHAGESHRLIEQYAGTDSWVFGVDGDELYDPARLDDFRRELLGGAYAHAFKVASNVLNCIGLDRATRTASGYLSPPSRSITKLYNFASIESWRGDGAERLHGGTIEFRPGYDELAVDNIGERLSWEETPLRCLHACFLRRSTGDPEPSGSPTGRPILEETTMHDRSWRGALKRRLRGRTPPDVSDWKREKYMRGDLVTVDASPFLGSG
jgi:Glycosyl transferase family 2